MSIRLASFIFLLILISACSGVESFDETENINYNAEFAIPIFNSKIAISDVVEDDDANTSIRIESDGSVTALFNGDLVKKTAAEIMFPIPGLGDVILPDTNSYVPFVFDNFLIKRAIINQDVIHFKFENNLEEDILINLKIPSLVKDGNVFEANFVLVYTGSLPVSLRSPDFSLEGYELSSENNTINYIYDARRSNGDRIVLTKAIANVNYLTFEFVEGFFGANTLDIDGDIITIGIYDQWVGGTLEFENPKVTLRVDNAFGFPVRSQVNLVNMTTLSGEVLDLEAENLNEGIDFNYPRLDQVGEIESTFIEFNKDNSNIKEIFNEKATKFFYDIDALANPDNDTTIIGFTTDTAFFLINAAVELPIKGKADDFTLIDTVANDFEIKDYISEAEFKLITQNHFPVDIQLQIEFYTEEGIFLDQMFEAPLLLESAELLPDGSTQANGEKTTFINYDLERLDKIREAKKMLVRVNMTSYNDATEIVSILESFTIDARMGAKLLIVD